MQYFLRLFPISGCIFLFVAASLLCGCGYHAPAYYGGGRSVFPMDGYKLAFLEFGEFGSYKDPSELANARDLVRNTENPFLVIYIHGWHNDATSDDRNKFANFLSRLARTNQIQNNQLKVVGVYFAWPGESLRIPGINTFTFWSRKLAAERVASNYDCLDAIQELSRVVRAHRPGYIVLIGHSFGGLILERTLAHTLRTLQGQKGVSVPWDLALMLNPASDSLLARQLVESLDTFYTYDSQRGFVPREEGSGDVIPENAPFVVELQSENDNATRLTFPIGSILGGIIGGTWAWNRVMIPGVDNGTRTPRGSISEREFYLRTPGNNHYLINYEIKDVTDGSQRIAPRSYDAFELNLSYSPKQRILDRIFYTSSPKNWKSAVNSNENLPPPWRVWRIRYAADVTPRKYRDNLRLPFWIVRVPSWIIDDHGGIWSDNSMALMAALFRMRYPNPAPPKAYTLPSRPSRQREQLYRSVQ
jgi:pimeloyl-ACP methyl ester carboxylesterase